MQLELRSFVLPASHSPVRQKSNIIINNFCHNRGELNKLMSQHFCISLLKMKMMWIITSGFYSDQMPHTTFSESILGKMVGQYRESCSTALSFFLLIYHTNTAMIQIRMHSLAGIFFLVCFWVFQPFLLNRTVKQTGKETERAGMPYRKWIFCFQASSCLAHSLSLQYYRMLLLPTNK